jgi:hypothetical protein
VAVSSGCRLAGRALESSCTASLPAWVHDAECLAQSALQVVEQLKQLCKPLSGMDDVTRNEG